MQFELIFLNFAFILKLFFLLGKTLPGNKSVIGTLIVELLLKCSEVILTVLKEKPSYKKNTLTEVLNH